MKNKFLHLSLLVLAFTGCTKSVTTAPVTSLQITTLDTRGAGMSGTTVTLYISKEDLTAATHPVAVNITGLTGTATFSGLHSIVYYWMASNQCANNMMGCYSTSGAILPDSANVATSVLTGNGTLSFVNSSPDPYTIYVNGKVSCIVNGNSTVNSPYCPIGLYAIRAVQNSGYASKPIDDTFNSILVCGGTLVTNFPFN